MLTCRVLLVRLRMAQVPYLSTMRTHSRYTCLLLDRRVHSSVHSCTVDVKSQPNNKPEAAWGLAGGDLPAAEGGRIPPPRPKTGPRDRALEVAY